MIFRVLQKVRPEGLNSLFFIASFLVFLLGASLGQLSAASVYLSNPLSDVGNGTDGEEVSSVPSSTVGSDDDFVCPDGGTAVAVSGILSFTTFVRERSAGNFLEDLELMKGAFACGHFDDCRTYPPQVVTFLQISAPVLRGFYVKDDVEDDVKDYVVTPGDADKKWAPLLECVMLGIRALNAKFLTDIDEPYGSMGFKKFKKFQESYRDFMCHFNLWNTERLEHELWHVFYYGDQKHRPYVDPDSMNWILTMGGKLSFFFDSSEELGGYLMRAKKWKMIQKKRNKRKILSVGGAAVEANNEESRLRSKRENLGKRRGAKGYRNTARDGRYKRSSNRVRRSPSSF